MRRTRFFPALLLPFGLLGLGLACGGGGSSSAGTQNPTPVSGGGHVGDTAKNITGIDAAGSTTYLSSFKGQVILLDISAMWCGWCQTDAPTVETIYQQYSAQGLKVITCLTEDTSGKVPTQANLQSWTDTYGLTFPVMNDTGATAESTYISITGGFPTFVIIDKQFVVQYIQGGLDEAAVKAKIETLLAQ